VNDQLVEQYLTAREYVFPLRLEDHIGGFYAYGKNKILDRVDEYARAHDVTGLVYLDFPIDTVLRQNYKNLEFKYSFWSGMEFYRNYHIHPEIKFDNFLCSFNGAHNVGRRLLLSILNKTGLFNKNTCTKNFQFSWDQIIGDVELLAGNSVYDKFFVDSASDFNNKIISLNYQQFSHTNNLQVLENIVTRSFVNVSSETIPVSYYPFYSEKFLLSIVTRGLFVFYAQPTWHKNLETFYGFKKYDKIFDYSFDEITNPIHRLIRLIEMILKFSNLSVHDWTDLYLVEQETIEYNYDRYFSGDYLENLI